MPTHPPAPAPPATRPEPLPHRVRASAVLLLAATVVLAFLVLSVSYGLGREYGDATAEDLEVAVDGIDAPLEGTVRWVSSDASFTPYFALTEHDRSRLSYLAEVDLAAAAQLPSGVPLEARLPAAGE